MLFKAFSVLRPSWREVLAIKYGSKMLPPSINMDVDSSPPSQIGSWHRTHSTSEKMWLVQDPWKTTNSPLWKPPKRSSNSLTPKVRPLKAITLKGAAGVKKWSAFYYPFAFWCTIIKSGVPHIVLHFLAEDSFGLGVWVRRFLFSIWCTEPSFSLCDTNVISKGHTVHSQNPSTASAGKVFINLWSYFCLESHFRGWKNDQSWRSLPMWNMWQQG